VRSIDVGARGKKVARWLETRPRTTTPVLETALDKVDTNEHNSRAFKLSEIWQTDGFNRMLSLTSDNWRYNLEKDLRRDEGDQNFKESAACCGAQQCAVSLGT